MKGMAHAPGDTQDSHPLGGPPPAPNVFGASVIPMSGRALRRALAAEKRQEKRRKARGKAAPKK